MPGIQLLRPVNTRAGLTLLFMACCFLFTHAALQAQVNTWENLYGGGGLDNGVALATLSQQDGDVVVIGSVQYSSSPDRWKLTITRLDQNGAIVWENTYPFFDNEYEIHPDAFDIIEMSTGDIAFVANYRKLNVPNPDWDVLIGVLNANGTLLTPTFWTVATGGKDDVGRGITEAKDGEIVVVGTVWNQLSSTSQSDIFATKLNIMTGITSWSFYYGTEGREEAWDVKEYGADSRLMIAGFADEAASSTFTDPLLMTVGRWTGVFRFATLQGKANSDGLFHELVLTDPDRMFVCGLDCPNGTSEVIISSAVIGFANHTPGPTFYYNYAGVTNGHHGGFHIDHSHTPDHLVVTGFAQTNTAGEQDLMLMEFNRWSMMPTWVRTSPRAPTNTIDHGHAVAPFTKTSTGEQGYWVSGTSVHSAGFGSRDWYVLRTSGSGQTGCTFTPSHDMYSIDGFDQVFYHEVDFTPVSPIEMNHGALLMTTTICPIFSTFKNSDEASAGEAAIANLHAGPIPVEPGQSIDVRLENNFGDVDGVLRISDMTGRTRYEQNISLLAGEQTFKLPTANLEAGVYIVQVRTDAAIRTLKFIVR